LEVRSGRSTNADWQWGLGTNTEREGSFVQAHLKWISGRAYNFTLSYNGQGAGTYTVSYRGTELFSKTWRKGLQVGNALQFYAKTAAGIGAGNFITVHVTSINGAPVNATLQTAGDNLLDQATLAYVIPMQPSGGFTLSGTVAFTFTGHAPPTGSRMDFLITSGNVTCQSAREALYFISPDQLNTPCAVTDNTGKVIWSWASEPFGSMPPSEDPDGDGQSFTLNLRFPGQYFDQETGLHYNYYRDYDPSTGRYIESDPLGPGGGIHPYAYVNGNPIGLVDPTGLYWVYSQSTGNLYHVAPEGNTGYTGTNYVATGYAGHDEGVNNPDLQGTPNVGPLPRGAYTIDEQKTNYTSTGAKLPGSMRLYPEPLTDTLGRSGFLIHGGNFSTRDSSTGCIVLPPKIRDQIGGSGDPDLWVIR
jgi:RHS repeat-associated protein